MAEPEGPELGPDLAVPDLEETDLKEMDLEGTDLEVPDLAVPDLGETDTGRCWSRCCHTLPNQGNTHWVGSLRQCSSN